MLSQGACMLHTETEQTVRLDIKCWKIATVAQEKPEEREGVKKSWIHSDFSNSSPMWGIYILCDLCDKQTSSNIHNQKISEYKLNVKTYIF